MTSPSRHALHAAVLAALLATPAARAGEEAKPGPAQKPGPIVLAATADVGAAAAEIEKATGAKGGKLPFGEIPLAEGRSFEIEAHVAERLLNGSHEPFKKVGLFLFRYERSFGMAGDKDKLALLKTTDHRAVIRKVGTVQSHHAVNTDKVIAWLDALAKDEPFELLEVGTDYIAGRFERAPRDATAVAKRCAEFAPDLVAGRASTLELLAAEIRTNRTLYLIW
jgi:hypothetical protein